MYCVVEIMLGMLMGVAGPFRNRSEARKYVTQENGKLKRDSDTYYQVWQLKEKIRAKAKTRKKARSKRTSKA